MRSAEPAKKFRPVRKGAAFALGSLAALFLCVSVSAQAPFPALWGCLLYASNNAGPAWTPVRLNAYGKRLEQETGFTSLQTVGESQAQFVPGHGGVLTFPGELRVTVTNISRERDGKLLVGLELFRGDKELLMTQAKLSQGSPLFIRGPAWRQGELIIAVVVGS